MAEPKLTLADAELRKKVLARWENEGGAPGGDVDVQAEAASEARAEDELDMPSPTHGPGS